MAPIPDPRSRNYDAEMFEWQEESGFSPMPPPGSPNYQKWCDRHISPGSRSDYSPKLDD
jgi:hypothetical protein